jgi:hypothetical protein
LALYTNSNQSISELYVRQNEFHFVFIEMFALVETIRLQYYDSHNGEIKAQSSLIPLIHDNNHIPAIETMTRPISIKIYSTINRFFRLFHSLFFCLH